MRLGDGRRGVGGSSLPKTAFAVNEVASWEFLREDVEDQSELGYFSGNGGLLRSVVTLTSRKN